MDINNATSEKLIINSISESAWVRARISGVENFSCFAYSDTAYYEVSDNPTPGLSITFNGENQYDNIACEQVSYPLLVDTDVPLNPTSRVRWTSANNHAGISHANRTKQDITYITNTELNQVYYVEVNDNYGCYAIDSVLIKSERSSSDEYISGPTGVCYGDSVTLVA